MSSTSAGGERKPSVGRFFFFLKDAATSARLPVHKSRLLGSPVIRQRDRTGRWLALGADKHLHDFDEKLQAPAAPAQPGNLVPKRLAPRIDVAISFAVLLARTFLHGSSLSLVAQPLAADAAAAASFVPSLRRVTNGCRALINRAGEDVASVDPSKVQTIFLCLSFRPKCSRRFDCYFLFLLPQPALSWLSTECFRENKNALNFPSNWPKREPYPRRSNDDDTSFIICGHGHRKKEEQGIQIIQHPTNH